MDSDPAFSAEEQVLLLFTCKVFVYVQGVSTVQVVDGPGFSRDVQMSVSLGSLLSERSERWEERKGFIN